MAARSAAPARCLTITCLVQPSPLHRRLAFEHADLNQQAGEVVHPALVQDKAEPGGINITEQVYLQIDGKVDVAMQPLGKVEL